MDDLLRQQQANYMAQQQKIYAAHHHIQLGDLDGLKATVEQEGIIILTAKGGPRNAAALEAACWWNQLEILRYLTLEKDLHKSEHGHRAVSGGLSSAAGEGHQQIIEFLLSSQAETNFTQNEINDAAGSACRGGHLGCLTYLANEHGARVDVGFLSEAAALGHLGVIQSLCGSSENHAFHINSPEAVRVFISACTGRTSQPIADYLMSQGMNVNAFDEAGHTPLVVAVLYDNLQMAQYLCHHGADVNLQDRGEDEMSPMEHACSSRRVEMVKILHSQGAVVTPWSLAYATATRGGLPTVKYLFEKTEASAIDINHPSEFADGKPFLCTAILSFDPEIVDYLLERGADPNLPNRRGDTPLYLIVEEAEGGRGFEREHAIVQALLSKGANPLLANRSGKTSLSRVLDHREGGLLPVIPPEQHLTMIFLLLKHGGFSGLMD